MLDRFTQIQPKLIFSVNAVIYNGKTHNHMEKLEKVVDGLSDLEKVVIIPYVVEDGQKVDLSTIKHGSVLLIYSNNLLSFNTCLLYLQ